MYTIISSEFEKCDRDKCHFVNNQILRFFPKKTGILKKTQISLEFLRSWPNSKKKKVFFWSTKYIHSNLLHVNHYYLTLLRVYCL